MKQALLKIVLIVIAGFSALVGKIFFKAKSTHPVQDALEDVVEDATGIDIGDIVDDIEEKK